MDTYTRTGTPLRFVIATLFNLCATAAIAAPVPVQTSTLDRSQNHDTDYGIGLTSSIAQRPFIGVDDQDTSLIYLSFSYKDFYVEGLDVGYQLLDNKDVSIDLLATPRFYEVEPAFAGNGELDGIDITKPTYFAGISTQYRTEAATFTLQLLADLNESDGNEFVITASKAFKPNTDFTLVPTLGITYQDAGLVDHFYGVQANEVRAGRPEYGGHASTNTHLSLNVLWQASKHIQLLGQIRYELLGSGITNSPIVDEDSITTALVGFVYRR